MGARYGYLRSVLKSSRHRLRAMEPRDVSQLHAWENASEDWWMGASVQPISMEAMQQFATGQHDLYRDRQLRWMLDALLSEGEWNTVGAVDLYDFDPRQRRAGVAIHVDQTIDGSVTLWEDCCCWRGTHSNTSIWCNSMPKSLQPILPHKGCSTVLDLSPQGPATCGSANLTERGTMS